MQHVEMTHINFQSSVFASKKTVNKILKLDQVGVGDTAASEALISVGGYNFSYPVFNTNCDSVQCT